MIKLCVSGLIVAPTEQSRYIGQNIGWIINTFAQLEIMKI